MLADSFVAGRGEDVSGAGIVYVDANPEDRPGAIVVTGNYSQDGQNWIAHLVFRKGAQRLQQSVTANRELLAQKVLEAIELAAAGQLK